MCLFKQYKDLFGNLGENVHKYRICDAALVDYVLTLLFAIFICKITNTPLVLSTILAFVIGIVFHILFGVQTSTVNYLGIIC